VPTDQQHFSKGYQGRRRAPRKAAIDGPPAPKRNRVAEHQGRTPQPSVPQGPRNSTKAERRNRAVRASLTVKPPVPTVAKAAAQRRREAALRATLGTVTGDRLHPKVPTVATATGKVIDSTPGFAPTKAEAFAGPVLSDLEKLHAEGKISKSLGTKIYEKVAEGGIYLLPEGAEIKAGAEGLSVALRGVAAEDGTRVGGSELLGKVLKPVTASTDEGRAAVAERAAQKAAAKEGSGVKAAARRAGERVTRSSQKADAAVARRVAGKATRKEAVAAAGAPLKVTKAAALQATPVVQGHEQALLDNPKKVLQTTARAIPGLVTAPVGQGIGLGITGGRAVSEGAHALGIPGARGYTGKQILEPAEHIGEEQLAFAKQIAKTLTSSDSAEVQKAVENELGLLLPVMLGLGGKAIGDKITKGRLLEATRKIVNNARSKVGKDHPTHNGQTPQVLEKAGQHKAESVRVARSKARSRREIHARTVDIRHEAGRAKGTETIRGQAFHAGDVLNFAVRHSLPLDKPAAALAEVKRIGAGFKDLPADYVAPDDQFNSRDVVRFIEKNPGVLTDKHLRREVQAYRDQGRHAREHAADLAPEHSETARFTPAAVTRDVPLKDERFPTSVRDITRAEPTRGKAAKDVLRRESKSDRQRARRLGRRASTKGGRARIMAREAAIRASQVEPRSATELARKEKITRLEARRVSIAAKRQDLRDKGSTSKAMTQYRRAQERINRQLEELQVEPTTARKQQRIELERRAEGLAATAHGQRTAAAKAAQLATRKHHAATEVDPTVEREFLGDISGRLKAEGLPEPEYTHTGKARGVSTAGMTGTKLVRFPGRSKRRTGKLDEYGMVQEGLAPTLRNSIAKPISARESFKALKSFHEENDYREGSKVEFTPDEVQQLVNEGKINLRDYVAIPRQESKRAFDPVEYAAQLKASLGDKGDPKAPRVRLARRPAAEEFAAQLSNAAILPALAKINRVTSYLILGTSPAWAAAQIVAEYAQGAAAQPKILNPLFVRRAIKAYKALPKEKRWAYDAWLGVTARDLDSPGELGFTAQGDPASASDAWSVMNRTPLGRTIKSIPHAIQRLDQWKGGGIRMLTAAAKVDHDLNRKGGSFLRGIRGMSAVIEKASAEMKGKSLEDQIAYIGDHPDLEHHFATYLDDVMGNWSALTKNERLASQIAIFYPFLRMSLRWTFYSFPKRHPIKAAVLAYMGQQNAVTLKKFLGRDPSYFSEWANVPVQLGPNKDETDVIPLGRIAPGGNTIIEAAGEATSLKGVGLKLVQPAVAAAIEEETGVNPLTGEQEDNGAAAALNSILELPGGVRTANEYLNLPAGQKRGKDVLPIVGGTERQEALDKLFDKLGEVGTAIKGARTMAVPFIPKSGEYTRDLVKTRAILKALDENSSSKRQEVETDWAYKHKGGGKGQIDKTLTAMEAKYEQADTALGNMLDKYKVPHEAEEEAGGQRYDEIHYHSKPGKGKTSFGGAAVKLPSKQPTSTGGASTFGGKAAPGPVAKPKKEPRFFQPTKTMSTFGGKAAR
jgi:hypothetical protein